MTNLGKFGICRTCWTEHLVALVWEKYILRKWPLIYNFSYNLMEKQCISSKIKLILMTIRIFISRRMFMYMSAENIPKSDNWQRYPWFETVDGNQDISEKAYTTNWVKRKPFCFQSKVHRFFDLCMYFLCFTFF